MLFPLNFVELVVGVITQLARLVRVTLIYPLITYFNFEHHAFNCLRKT
jgi:hypothetical protein